jgi:hypothetical protein
MDFLAFQLRNRLLANHTAVSHNAHPFNSKPFLQPSGDAFKALYICRVSRPQLAAQGVSFAVQNNTGNHLFEVRPMVFGIAVLPNRFSAVTFKIKRGRIKKHQIQAGEQIPPPFKDSLFNLVLYAARGESFHRSRILKRPPQPGHRPVKMLKLKAIRLVNPIGPKPSLGLPVGARTHQPMQNGYKYRTLNLKLVPPALQQFPNMFPNSNPFPQPAEYQARPDFFDFRFRIAGAGQKQNRPFGIFRQRPQELVHLSSRRQFLYASNCPDYPLPHAPLFTVTLNDL